MDADASGLASLAEGRQQRGRRSVVPKRLADVRETVGIARTEDEASAKLQGILSHLVLTMPSGACPLAGRSVVAAKQMQGGSGVEPNRPIGLSLLVNEKREGDAGFLAEGAGVEAVTQSHSGQGGSLGAELLLVLAQLRDVLAAEDSPVVPQEGDHGRLALPQGAQPNLVTFGIGEGDFGQLAAQRGFHSTHP